MFGYVMHLLAFMLKHFEKLLKGMEQIHFCRRIKKHYKAQDFHDCIKPQEDKIKPETRRENRRKRTGGF